MLFSWITVPTDALSVVSISPEALTSMVCDACPTVRVKSTRAVCCTCSSTPERKLVWKPGASTFTLYFPGFSEGKLYTPALLVLVVRAALVSELVAITGTPGAIAPD